MQGPRSIAEALDRAALSDRGVRFHRDSPRQKGAGHVHPAPGCHLNLSYAGLRTRSLAMARRLARRFERGQRLGLIAETGPFFLVMFHACQYAGLVPCPLPLTYYAGGKDAYLRRLAALAGAARLAAIVAPDSLRAWVADIENAAGIRVWTDGPLQAIEIDEHPRLAPLGADDPAYIQYSSGSTADPKGILITQRALCANVDAILRHGLKLTSADRAFSWLPFYHDMGLVGFSIAPVFGVCGVDYISPSAFARRPRLWLELMSEHRSTISYAPAFAYRLAAQRLGGDAAIDLSALRVAGVGGDMIDAGALDQFAAALAPSGFRREAFLPSYGMAEAVLAVAFGALGKPPRVDRPDGMASACVVCGKPLPGIDVLIADARGRPAPERVIGPIWLRGPNVIGAYLGNAEASRAIQRRDGFIDSGDLGYFDAGELVVTGRSKDLILHHGRNIWPRDVEWAAERVAPLKPGDAAAIGVEGEGTGEGDAAARRLVVLVQCGLLGDEPRDALRKRVASAVSEALGVAARVVLVGPRDLPRTSSGKLSRSRAKALWESINEQRSGTSQNHSFGRAVSAGREDR